jgi:RNA polymerase sigma-70 factor (ECF subfamily)
MAARSIHRSRPGAAATGEGLNMSRGLQGGRSTDPPDEVLVARYAAGDRAAFEELARRHEAPLYNFALRQVRSAALAQDIVQDVFVRVVQGVGDFKGHSRFSTWCFTIARNLCIDHARKQSLRRHASLDQPGSGTDDGEGQTLGDRTADAHPRATVDRSVIGDQLGDSIARAVDALPDDQREVFLLREIGQVPFKEIAEITGVPENTVKSRMRYALERLQRALAEYEDYAKALS